LGAQNLEAAGFGVVADAPLKVIARARTGKSEKVVYEEFGSFGRGPRTAVTFTPRWGEVAYEPDGQLIWKTLAGREMPRQHIRLEEGESIQQVVREYTEFDPMSITRVELADRVARHPGNTAFGGEIGEQPAPLNRLPDRRPRGSAIDDTTA